MDVNIALAEKIRINTQLLGMAAHIAECGLGRLLHYLSQGPG